MRLRLLLPLLCFPALMAAPLGFTRTGKGPGILLIHGFGGNKEVWKEGAAELAKDHTVLRVDLPGSGGSAGPKVEGGAADLETIAKDLVQLVHREKLTPCLIVGHSMGGPIAALAVLRDPASFRGLVLVDSFLSSIPAHYFENTLRGLETDPKATLTIFFGPMSASPAQRDRLVSEALQVPTPALQAYLRAMTQDYMGSRQHKLSLPVVQFAAGAEDADPAKVEAQRLEAGFKGLPNFRQIYFPKARHWVMWDEPVGFVKALEDFEKDIRTQK